MTQKQGYVISTDELNELSKYHFRISDHLIELSVGIHYAMKVLPTPIAAREFLMDLKLDKLGHAVIRKKYPGYIDWLGTLDAQAVIQSTIESFKIKTSELTFTNQVSLATPFTGGTVH